MSYRKRVSNVINYIEENSVIRRNKLTEDDWRGFKTSHLSNSDRREEGKMLDISGIFLIMQSFNT